LKIKDVNAEESFMRKYDHIKMPVIIFPLLMLIFMCGIPVIYGDTGQATNSTGEDQLTELHKQHDKLLLENGIADQMLQKSMAALQSEIEEITRKLDLFTKRAALKEAERKEKEDDQLADMKFALDKLHLSNDMAEAQNAGYLNDLNKKKSEDQFRMTELELQKMELDNKLSLLNNELELRDKQDQLNNIVKHEMQYAVDPLKNGVLNISDRRIALNDIITMDTADYVVERINYFNNQNTSYPIFIVIDSSPGGSVMAGYKILKAMNGSPAPVYVVVKSFAASMAANITTQAKKSFAYPNAIILHHQILSISAGNLTEQKESIQDIEEWWKRLATPVAQKMGISIDDFVKEMYKHRSTGDWMEFGDNAKKLKWVDQVVDTINEESYVKNPDSVTAEPVRPRSYDAGDRVDAGGKHFRLLPRLEPVDCYYIYNPDNYYRLDR
jgi:ATP-dependent Clp protease protease subunit